MSVISGEVSRLAAAIEAYGFPAVYFDFDAGRPVQAINMREVECVVQDMLRSPSRDRVKDGLANVLYWGYAQIGFGERRVRRFRDLVQPQQIESLQDLARQGPAPSLSAVAAIRMPEFSGVSFISKILAFMDPSDYCVLDKQLLKLAAVSGTGALHRVSAGTQIRVTRANEHAYDDWRAECRGISTRCFGGRYRVIDIERRFFQMVQSGDVAAAARIYGSA